MKAEYIITIDGEPDIMGNYSIKKRQELVRCKDCKWKQGAECIRFAEVRPFPDDFCSRAERRTE